MSPIAGVLWLLVAAGAGYYLAALFAALRFRAPRAAPFAPPVSILKPVRGLDRNFYDCIRSHAVQHYPQFELLFAAGDPADPAIGEIRRLAAEFPDRRIEVFLTEHEFGPNAKVNSLERLRRECRYDVLVVNDSDILVGPDYLRRVVAPLADPAVGLVTCPYRGIPGGGLPDLLQALWISTDFQVSILVAGLLGVKFALGATMVLRRRHLDQVGGFAPLAPYLADDYQLGKAIRGLGLGIVVSDYWVATILPRNSWGASWHHRLRWNRTVRVCNFWGYLGLVVDYAVPLSIAALALYPALWPLAAACLAVRLAAASLIGTGLLRDPLVLRYFFLIPLADLFSLVLWAAGFFGSKIVWRGAPYRLERSGRLLKV